MLQSHTHTHTHTTPESYTIYRSEEFPEMTSFMNAILKEHFVIKAPEGNLENEPLPEDFASQIVSEKAILGVLGYRDKD